MASIPPSFPLRSVTSLHWLGFLHYYGTIRHLAGCRLGFPLGYTLPTVIHSDHGACETSPGYRTLCSIHPDPNHVGVSCGSFPFSCFPVRCAPCAGFPDLWAGHPSPPPPLVHILFRAGLCLQTLRILLCRRHPVHPSPFGERMCSSATALEREVTEWILTA